MALNTAFTELFSLRHPIALAPMGGASGGALAAAVSQAGGLGLVGGGRQDDGWLEQELQIVATSTSNPWGVGFQSWATGTATVARALTYQPAAVMLSFGDPRPLAGLVRAAGAALIMQVTDMAEAREAIDLGADVIVAQGAEAGGHGSRRSTLPFVPVVADLAAPTPVLAAGGIADGRGLAAALVLGAAGFTGIWQAAEKIVFSTTLQSVSTARTRIERTFDPDAVRQLKSASEQDMTVGGADLAGQAIRAGLVDELQLFLVPVIVGGGKQVLPDGVRSDMELLDTQRFGCGAVYLRYRLTSA